MGTVQGGNQCYKNEPLQANGTIKNAFSIKVTQLADGHLHLVAAPGSGENNFLGESIYHRLWSATPDLSSYCTIRQQLVDRIIRHS